MRCRRRTRLRTRYSRARQVYRARRYLLTKNEAAFFRALNSLVGESYLVSCKVRLADIVTCADRNWRRGLANRIAQKHVDFVVSRVDTSRVVAVIELDDRTHSRPDRRLRDAFVNDLLRHTRIRLIRVPASSTYEVENVRDYLARNGVELEAGAKDR